MTRIFVGSYDVIIGTGMAGEIPAMVGEAARTVAVVHPESLPVLAEPVCAALSDAGHRVVALPVPDGEACKRVEVLAGLWSSFAQARMTRSDAIVGIGGGATTDLAGFAAASWLRGVRVVLVPTTLLGMVDAAVGGKTAIDIPEGKNLVGAFYPPAGVVCDLDSLTTVPSEDYIAGLAEIIKAGFIADPRILSLVSEDPAGAADPAGPHTAELVERAIAMKARVVTEDLRESGLREILNYGHTLGHAIEKVERYRYRHGYAVAVGMVYAAALARLTGRPDLLAEHRAILTTVGLPTSYTGGGSWPDLRAAMSVDKKARGATLRFIVLDGIGSPAVLPGPGEDLLEKAFAEVAG
jgi:3-dehydroquinate synthase